MIKILEHGIKKVTCPNCKAKLFPKVYLAITSIGAEVTFSVLSNSIFVVNKKFVMGDIEVMNFNEFFCSFREYFIQGVN